MCRNESIQGSETFCWDCFCRGYGPPLRGIARCALMRRGARASDDAVDDVSQEVLCRVVESGQLAREAARHSRGQVLGYLRRVANSVVVDELRAQGAAKRGGGQAPVAEEAMGGFESRPHGDPDPERALLQRESREILRRRVRACGAGREAKRNGRILELTVFDDALPGEVATALGPGVSRSCVHTVLHRMRRRLAREGRESLLD